MQVVAVKDLGHSPLEAEQKAKVTVVAYLLTSVGFGADTGLLAVSPRVTYSHKPNGRLPLLSARPAVIPSRPKIITVLSLLWPVLNDTAW